MKTRPLYLLAAFQVVAFSSPAATIEVCPGPGAIEKAQREVRALIGKDPVGARLGGIEVVLADGVYRLSKTIFLDERDNGTNDMPVVWRAAHRGKVVISGAAAVEPMEIDWSRPPASLVPAESRAEVKAYRIGGKEPIPGWRDGMRNRSLTESPIQVHLGGRRLRVATWPREEFARTGQPVTPIVDSINVWGSNRRASFGGDFRVEGVPQLAKWAKEPDLWAFGMWHYEWSATTSPVLKIDPVDKVMCVDTNQNAYGFLANRPYNVFNAFSEIKVRGDWAVDRAARVLYIRQEGDEVPEVSLVPDLFVGYGHSCDIVFQDFIFEHPRRSALRFTRARRVVVRSSLFRGIGDTAVIFAGDSRNCIANGCDFHDLGRGAVRLEGGVQKTLAPASNVVENCHIHHFGVVSPIAQPAISMSGVGNRAEHNLIHHFRHQGITFLGNDHYCGFNVLHDGVMYNNDAGMIYSSAYDWSFRGSVCEYNCVFMAGKQPLSSHVNGIYMDGWASGVTVRGNIVNRASQGMFMSGGNDNVVVENIVVNCPWAIHLASLGADSFAKGAALQGEKSFLYKELFKKREMLETDLWRARYPRVIDLLNMTNRVDAHNAYWHRCTNNVMCATTGLKVDNAEKVLPTYFMKDNVEIDGDPGFVDYDGFDWELRADSPMRKILPVGTRFAEMGLYDSPWRFSPAVKHGDGMSRPRPFRTEFDQGDVAISVVMGRWHWHEIMPATPEWRECVYEEIVEKDCECRIALSGGGGYKTMYDDVRVEGHPEIDGTFENGDAGWTWNKVEKPSLMGELGTPHGVVESDEAANGRFVAMANNSNAVVSPSFKLKKGEKLRVVLKAKQYVPDFIRKFWKRAE